MSTFSDSLNVDSTKFGIFAKTFYAEDIYDHRIIRNPDAESFQPYAKTEDLLEPVANRN